VILRFIQVAWLTALAAEPADRITVPGRDWDRERAAHLLRRAGLGGSAEEIDRIVGFGFPAAVDYLVDFHKTPQTDPDYRPSRAAQPRRMRKSLEDLPEERQREVREQLRVMTRVQLQEYRAWWVRRMVVTARPLEEKLTLFWHGHFTSGAEEVKSSRLIIEQNQLLRRHAAGRFGQLLRAICRDRAMLSYLNGASNRKDHPNENFARELLELFTLGEGHYTEKDVTEAARAFTGWGFDEDAFRFRRGQHDFGEKTFLGRTGNFDGDDIVDIILEQPAAADHIAEALVGFFVADEPPSPLIERIAAVLRASDFDIREAMRAIFKSREFYSPAAMHARIKSPPEFVVGAVKSLEIPPDDCDFWTLARAIGETGQELFQPPNVKGWDGGPAWITSATLVGRERFVSALLRGDGERSFARRQTRLKEVEDIKSKLAAALEGKAELHIEPWQVPIVRRHAVDPAELLTGSREWTSAAVVDRLVDRLIAGPIDPGVRDEMIRLLDDQRASQREPLRAGGTPQIRRLIEAIMSLPEFHLG
jgi:uncharacterized protein (DUF1800 family)